MHSSLALAPIAVFVLAAAACSGSDSSGDIAGNPTKPDAGATTNDDGGSTGDDGGGTGADAGKPIDSGTPFVPATHPPYPQIPKNQGTVLSGMKLVTIVAANEDATVATSLFGLSDSMKSGTWFATVGADYGVQPPATSVHITGATITTNVNATQMVAYINASIAGHPEAAPDGNTFYMLYLPDGIWDVDQNGNPNTNCQLGHAGYHAETGNGNPWGVGVHCPTSGLSRIQDLGITGSHEIIEAASDPHPFTNAGYRLTTANPPFNGSPWTYGSGGENGDLCYGTSMYSSGFKLQRIWSNTAAQGQGDPCLPATPEAFYNTSAPQGWYTVAAGGTVQVPLTGYSDKPKADWIVQAGVITARVQGFSASITSATSLTVGGTKYPSINNGKTATLTITAPNAPSGSWALLQVYSMGTSGGTDAFHYWPVGVHIP